MTKAQQDKMDALFIAIGRLEARALHLATEVTNNPQTAKEYAALRDVATSLEGTWRILSDRGLVV